MQKRERLALHQLRERGIQSKHFTGTQQSFVCAIFVSVATASTVHSIVNKCADNHVCFFYCALFLCSAKKLACVAAMICWWRMDWKSSDAQIRHCISGILYSFLVFDSEDVRGTASVNSSVSYFYLQGSKHLH